MMIGGIPGFELGRFRPAAQARRPSAPWPRRGVAIEDVQGRGADPLVRIVATDGDVVELAATTANGEIRVITGMIKMGDTLVLSEFHIDGPGAGSLGVRGLRRLATEFATRQGARRVTIRGAARTTGANPGRTPRPMTFFVGD